LSVADRVYARALYDAARERGNVKDVQAQLASVAEAMAEVPQLRSVIGNPQIDAGSKAAVLEAAVGEPNELVSNFLKLAAEKGRAGSVEGIRAELDEMVARAEGQLTVTLTTAYELSDEEAKDIVGRIEQASGRMVEAVRKVDPELIGGIVLQAGSLRADASVRGRLSRLALELGSRG
jgi:F-type H+-transporting ATPase subunit delta